MDAYEEHWKATGIRTRSSALMGIGGVFSGLVLGLGDPWFFLLAAVSIVLLSMLALRNFLHRSAFRDAPKFAQEIALVFSTTGMKVATAEGSSDLAWTAFQRKIETSEYFLLYLSKRSFSIIPKTAFSDEAALSQFREWIHASDAPGVLTHGGS